VQEIINTGKLIFVSLGMTSEVAPFGISKNISYFWCKSEYPAYPWNLTKMPKFFLDSVVDGYSDHSVGIEVPLMAIMRGATIIEKHFTLDKSDTTIRDHSLSATPSEFRHLVELGRAIKRNLDIGV
jgi:sialic acid synthase SpsE